MTPGCGTSAFQGMQRGGRAAEGRLPRPDGPRPQLFLPRVRALAAVAVFLAWALIFSGNALAARALPPLLLDEPPGKMPGGPAGYTYTLPVSANSPISRFFQLQSEIWARENQTSLNVEFVPGRGGSQALARAQDAPRDGSVIFAVSYPDFFLQDMIKKPYYRPDDIQCVIVYARSPMVLWVRDDGEFPDLHAFLNHVRALPDPYMVSGGGSFTSAHLASLRFDRVSGSRSLYMPQLDEAAGIKAVTGKKTLAWWGHPYPRELAAGLKPLAVSGRERVESLPDVPTFIELGLDFVEETFFGLGVPSGSDPLEAGYIYEQFRYTLATPDFKKQSLEMGFLPFETAPADITPFLDAQRARSESLKRSYDWF